MKKIFSTILALTLVLSMSVPAYAEVTVDGETKTPSPVTHEGDAQFVSANDSGDKLTVTGDVTGNDGNVSVTASNGAEINVGGNVTESGNCNAISATEGANVTIEGNVTEENSGRAIYAKDAETEVMVKGNVTEGGDATAIESNAATVIIVGNVEEDGSGNGISAGNGATVIVGGNVTKAESTASDAVCSVYNGTVIVEGLVNGTLLNTSNKKNTGTIYLGELNGKIRDNSDSNNIHYLIGTAAEGSVALNAINLISDIVAAETIDGVTESGYKYTTTADTAALSGKTITLKPATGKILTVSGFSDANVTYVANEDGTVTFTIGDDFKGGLQNLVLVITDKPTPKPDPKKTGSSNGGGEKKGASVETTLSTGNYQMTPAGYAPFVAGNTATAGWATITEAVIANAGGTVAVTMNGAVTVDKQVLSTAAASKTSLALGLDNSVNVGLTPDTMSQIMASSSTDAAGNVVDPFLQVSAVTYNQAISSPVGTCGFTYEEMASIGAGENAPVVKVVTSNTDASKLLTIIFNAAEQGMKPGDVAHLYGGKSGEMGYGYDVIVDENGMATFVVPAVNGFWAIGSVMK